jgi:hypothetical protein
MIEFGTGFEVYERLMSVVIYHINGVTKMKKFLIIIFSTISFAQPVINGDLSDGQYTIIASKLNSNNGFGSAIDINTIKYYADAVNSVLYFGVVGKLNVSNNDGIGVWINIGGTGSPTGTSSGNSLSVSGGGHYIGGNGGTNPNFKADFEVDFQFAFNPGSGNTSVYFDAAKMIGTPSQNYQGLCNQSGSSTTNSSANGTVFTLNSVTFAFNNGGGVNQGLEMSIPFSEIGATSTMSLEAFAFLVSSTAYFSDVTVPGDITTGNPGFDTDFSQITGSYHSTVSAPLPVEFTSFSASVFGSSVKLSWQTATEVNNYGFEVERKVGGLQQLVGKWEKLGFVNGNGNSNSPKSYSFEDKNVNAGKYDYRLKQIDTDGKFEYSKIIEIDFGSPMNYEMSQNYPNPFNPSTTIRFSVSESSFINLSVYNSLGEKVEELVNEVKEVGVHSINFKAESLPSGIYFYRLQTPNFTQTKKMILLK